MADSLFPFIDATIADAEASTDGVSIPKEYQWDFKNSDFVLENGKPVAVEGNEALKIWIMKALQTPRYRYLAYSWAYGHELENAVGQGLSAEAARAEVERYIKEALTVNPYITGIKDIEVAIDGSKASVNFTAETDQGEVEISV